jgi:hypothetical protein
MRKQKFAVGLAIVGIQTCATVWPQGLVSSVPDRAIVEQKQALVARLLDDSRITDSSMRSNRDARDKLTAAAQHAGRAQAQLEKGEIAAADRLLNDAMRHISSARSLVFESAHRATAEHVRYTELIQSIEVLEASYLRNIERRSAWLAEAGDEDLKRVKIFVGRAKDMAAAGQVTAANAELIKAQRDMISSYNKLLGTAPLIYDLRFQSVEEEYKYETERGRDYEGLVPVAIMEYGPVPESLARINQLLDESRALAAAARVDGQKGQFKNAILTQRRATAKLQRALELAGIVVPQTLPN